MAQKPEELVQELIRLRGKKSVMTMLRQQIAFDEISPEAAKKIYFDASEVHNPGHDGTTRRELEFQISPELMETDSLLTARFKATDAEGIKDAQGRNSPTFDEAKTKAIENAGKKIFEQKYGVKFEDFCDLMGIAKGEGFYITVRSNEGITDPKFDLIISFRETHPSKLRERAGLSMDVDTVETEARHTAYKSGLDSGNASLMPLVYGYQQITLNSGGEVNNLRGESDRKSETIAQLQRELAIVKEKLRLSKENKGGGYMNKLSKSKDPESGRGRGCGG